MRYTNIELKGSKRGEEKMTKKAMTRAGRFGAIAMAGAVGLLMSGGNTMPRRMAKRTGKVMSSVGHKMQNVAHTMGKS